MWAVRKADELSQEEQAQLDTWLAEDPGHAAVLRAAEEALADLTEMGAQIKARGLYPPPDKRLPRRAMAAGRLSSRAAAGAAAWPGRDASEDMPEDPLLAQRHATGIGQERTVFGQEQIVSLVNGSGQPSWGTKAHIESFLKSWVTQVCGEARFKVHAEPGAFVVHASDWVLRTGGAAFDVSRRARSMFRVAANQEAILGAGGSGVRRELPGGEIYRRPAWRTGRVLFNGQSVREAVAEINGYGARQVVASDPRAREEPLSGTFPISGRKAVSSN